MNDFGNYRMVLTLGLDAEYFYTSGTEDTRRSLTRFAYVRKLTCFLKQFSIKP
jgi:hypothetical protein